MQIAISRPRDASKRLPLPPEVLTATFRRHAEPAEARQLARRPAEGMQIATFRRRAAMMAALEQDLFRALVAQEPTATSHRRAEVAMLEQLLAGATAAQELIATCRHRAEEVAERAALMREQVAVAVHR